MSVKPMAKNGLSGKTTTVTLFYDGDKYKDPVPVGINGQLWLVKRGEPVEVPIEVAYVINDSLAQDGKTQQLIRDLAGKGKEIAEL